KLSENCLLNCLYGRIEEKRSSQSRNIKKTSKRLCVSIGGYVDGPRNLVFGPIAQFQRILDSYNNKQDILFVYSHFFKAQCIYQTENK
ncbi:hypothetical protein CU098_007563, partial [Rhizopus stolonifer]